MDLRLGKIGLRFLFVISSIVILINIAGLFFKQGNLNKDQLGIIEVKLDCAFVSVHASIAGQLIKLVDNSRLKKKKVRVTVI